MADAVDMAQRHSEVWNDAAVRAACVPVPPGAPGKCKECGDDMPRLINGLCATCREPAPVPRRW